MAPIAYYICMGYIAIYMSQTCFKQVLCVEQTAEPSA